MPTETAVAKTDIVQNLVKVTGKTTEELRLACVSLLPKEVRGSFENLSAFVMRCRSLDIDPFGMGVYAAMMRGNMHIMLHYNTLIGIAIRKGLIPRDGWHVEAVYPGEKFSFTPHSFEHTTDPPKRVGIPLGAYCFGKATGSGKPLCVYISYKDFARSSDPSSAWVKSAYEMTTKAAIKIFFKRLFPDVYAGVLMEGDELPPIQANITEHAEAETEAAADEIFDGTEGASAPEYQDAVDLDDARDERQSDMFGTEGGGE